MRVEMLNDGTKVLHLSPIDGVPKYNDWMQALLDRGAAYLTDAVDRITGKTLIDTETGLTKKRIVPLDRNQEQAADLVAGNVEIVCIGCGKGAHKMDMSRIRIGGLIQMTHEERIAEREIHVKWRVQPVFKLGLGCKACQAQFELLASEAASQNQYREVYGQLLAEVAVNGSTARAIAAATALEMQKATKTKCLHGLIDVYCGVCRRNNPNLVKVTPQPVLPKAPKMFTPFIDVFDRDISGQVAE